MSEKITKEERKLALWGHMISQGWAPVGFNCLYNQDNLKERIRLNFRDDKVLALEVCREPKVEKDPTRKTKDWIVLESGPYDKVTIGESNELIFPKKEEKKTTTKNTATKVEDKKEE